MIYIYNLIIIIFINGENANRKPTSKAKDLRARTSYTNGIYHPPLVECRETGLCLHLHCTRDASIPSAVYNLYYIYLCIYLCIFSIKALILNKKASV